MKRLWLILMFITVAWGAEKPSNVFLIENKISTSQSDLGIVKDIDVFKQNLSFSYFYNTGSWLYYGGFKHRPAQKIADTWLDGNKISQLQRGNQFEIGTGYRWNLTERWSLIPSIVGMYNHIISTQVMQQNGLNLKTSTTQTDSDIRPYLLATYRVARGSKLIGSIRLDNDLLSNDRSKDFSSYPIQLQWQQFINTKVLLNMKVETALRDKEYRNGASGQSNQLSFGMGIGFVF